MAHETDPARRNWVADALQLVNNAACTYEHDLRLSDQLTDAARKLLGTEALLAIVDGGTAGQLPRPGSAGFRQLIQLAEAGNVDIATVIMVKDHEWVSATAPATPTAPEPDRALLSLTAELTAMGMIGSSPPPPAPAPAATVPPQRPVTPPGARIPWQPPGHHQATTGEEPKLAVEIIPTSLHGQNPRTQFGRAWWDATRKPAYAKAGYRCEICGGRGPDHPVELHERYSYDEHARLPVQRCTGLIVLCPACHAVKHLYRTGTIAAKTNDPAALDNALRHQREVNGWTIQQQDRYLAQVRRTFERREALGPWTTDYTDLYFA